MKRKPILFVLIVILVLSAASCGSEPAKTGPEYAEEFDIDALPEGLEEFLIRFSLYHDPGRTEYDSSDPGDVNMLECVGGSSFIADPHVYGMEQPEWFFFEADPENRGGSGYILMKASDVEWIAGNIFHVSGADMEKMVEKGDQEDLFYRTGDFYCFLTDGFGDSDPYCTIGIRSARSDGDKYYIVYDEMSPFGDVWGTYYAVMDTTEEGYWTLYSTTDAIPEVFGL